ncbi:MAG: pyridoxal phosphate-dependent aminotransferase [Clostridia bacterium]
MLLNQRATDLKQGAIRAMFDRAANYPDAINLGIGEPETDTPKPIIEAGIAALEHGKTHYTPNAGIRPLRERIAKHLCERGMQYSFDEVIITAGGMGALANILMVVIESGDEVLIQDPQWLNYASQIRFFGGKPKCVKVTEENGYRLCAADLERAITKRTKLVMLNSPNNPTGAVLTSDGLAAIADVIRRHDLYVISDEVYSTILFDGAVHHSIAEQPGMKERCIIVNSFSKAFAMTGWRVGYAAGPSYLIDKLTKLQENTLACVAAVSQYAALESFHYSEYSVAFAKDYEQRRDYVLTRLNAIDGISCGKPGGTFYVFPNVSSLGADAVTVANELLEKAGVITVPGSGFGEAGEGHLRLSLANSTKNIEKAMDRIERYAKSRRM